MPRPGAMISIPIAEQPGQPPCIADRPRSTDADHLHAIVDPVTEESSAGPRDPSSGEAARAGAASLPMVQCDGLRRSDRLSEGAARPLDESGGRTSSIGSATSPRPGSSVAVWFRPKRRVSGARLSRSPIRSKPRTRRSGPSRPAAERLKRQEESTRAPCRTGATKVGPGRVAGERGRRPIGNRRPCLMCDPR